MVFPDEPTCRECGEQLYPQNDYCMSCGTSFEEAARFAASEAYHDHPSNPSSCAAYAEHTGRNERECPCEHAWSKYLPGWDEDGEK